MRVSMKIAAGLVWLGALSACSSQEPASSQSKVLTLSERFAKARNQEFADLGPLLAQVSERTPSLEGSLQLEPGTDQKLVRLRGEWRFEALVPSQGFHFRTPNPEFIRLLEAKVNGQVVRVQQLPNRWIVPAMGERARIELRFEVTLDTWRKTPAFEGGSPLQVVLNLLPQATLNTVSPVVRVGTNEALLADAWPWPLWEGGNVLSAVHLSLPLGYRAVGTIHDTWRGLARGGLGLYLQRAPDVMEMKEGELTFSLYGVAPEELPTLIRRGLERWREFWGPLHLHELHIVKTDLLNPPEDGLATEAAVVRTGLVVLPSARFMAKPRQEEDLRPIPPPSSSPRRLKQQVAEILDASVKEHPAKRDAFTLTLLDAIALQWWLGGEGHESQGAVAEAMARRASLALLAETFSPEHAERVRELHLRLPYQVAREIAGTEPILYTPDWQPSSELQQGLAAAKLKLGLGVDELARLMGEELWREAEQAMRRSPLGSWSFEPLRTWLIERGAQAMRAETWLRAWLMERTADQLVGNADLLRLMELVLVEGSVEGLKHALMGSLAGEGLVTDMLRDLLNGQAVLEGVSAQAISELLGVSEEAAAPWLKHAQGLMKEEGRGEAIFGLAQDLFKLARSAGEDGEGEALKEQAEDALAPENTPAGPKRPMKNERPLQGLNQ